MDSLLVSLSQLVKNGGHLGLRPGICHKLLNDKKVVHNRDSQLLARVSQDCLQHGVKGINNYFGMKACCGYFCQLAKN